MSRYIVESINEPRQYWNEDGPILGWTPERIYATEFSQETRDNGGRLPDSGCWVIVAEAPAKRSHFTTIKLRPVAIRLSVAEADFDDLNAQALEFEAALRQWVKGQQILTDGWMVDVLAEDE